LVAFKRCKGQEQRVELRRHGGAERAHGTARRPELQQVRARNHDPGARLEAAAAAHTRSRREQREERFPNKTQMQPTSLVI
jgi:hypothetical protein